MHRVTSHVSAMPDQGLVLDNHVARALAPLTEIEVGVVSDLVGVEPDRQMPLRVAAPVLRTARWGCDRDAAAGDQRCDENS